MGSKGPYILLGGPIVTGTAGLLASGPPAVLAGVPNGPEGSSSRRPGPLFMRAPFKIQCPAPYRYRHTTCRRYATSNDPPERTYPTPSGFSLARSPVATNVNLVMALAVITLEVEAHVHSHCSISLAQHCGRSLLPEQAT
jgi:hypothetical protein